MKKYIKSRKIRYGSVAIVLTLLILAATVMVNVILSMLSSRYSWMFVDMNSYPVYDISEDCEEYLSEYVISRVDQVNAELTKAGKQKEKIKIIFCSDKEDILASDDRKYIHDAVYQIDGMFPGYLEIEYLNIWENPKYAASLGVTSDTDMVCMFGDRHETMMLSDFYVFDAATSTPVAYNGEKIIASCLMRVTQKETPMCYLTANHGEALKDYEFMRSLVEAGYTISFLDLAESDIPENCDLLVTFAPKQDFVVSDSVSATSEIDKLDAYMSNGGKYMVFLSADTFASGARENLEGFLKKWGITYKHEPAEDGSENIYVIKDSAHSTSVDGYSVIAECAESGLGAEMFDKKDNASNVFANTTCIEFADDFSADGNGNYVKTVNGAKRYAYPIMQSYSSAEAWAGGRAVARATDEPFVLMAMASQKCENGKTAYVVASASSEFACEDSMQSAVLGNSKTMAKLYKHLGRYNAPADLVFKTFGSTEIEGLSQRNANILTILMIAIPTVACIALGTVVLVRRKNA